MNVLLTCAGRRNYLVNYFQQALGNKGIVFAADQLENAPALQDADAMFVMPDVYNPGYIDNLFSICKNNNVRLVVPLNDLELPVLAESKKRFYQEGILLAVSDTGVVEKCLNKIKTVTFAETHNITTPASFFSMDSARQALNYRKLSFPVIVRPTQGSASFGINVCHDYDELVHAYELLKKRIPRSIFSRTISSDTEQIVMIQEMLSGEEYGLDVVNDLEGNYVCTFAKRKLAMRAGETDKAITVENHELANIGEKIGKSLGHIGVLDCDIFVNEHGCFLIDMNARFGGGYPFSHVAGANIPAALIAWANGKKPDNAWLKTMAGVTAAKYDNLIIVRSENHRIQQKANKNND